MEFIDYLVDENPEVYNFISDELLTEKERYIKNKIISGDDEGIDQKLLEKLSNKLLFVIQEKCREIGKDKVREYIVEKYPSIQDDLFSIYGLYEKEEVI